MELLMQKQVVGLDRSHYLVYYFEYRNHTDKLARLQLDQKEKARKQMFLNFNFPRSLNFKRFPLLGCIGSFITSSGCKLLDVALQLASALLSTWTLLKVIFKRTFYISFRTSIFGSTSLIGETQIKFHLQKSINKYSSNLIKSNLMKLHEGAVLIRF